MPDTPQNPWGRPDDGETREFTPQQQYGQPYPQTPAPAPQRPDRGRGGLVAAVLAVVLVLVVIGGVVWFITAGGDDDADTKADGNPVFTTSPDDTTGDTAGDTTAAGTDPTTVSPGGSPVPTTGAGAGSGSSVSGSAGRSGNSGSGSSGSPDSSAVAAGLDRNGWSGYPDATCNADDTWVYAGGNSSTKVVVCRVGDDGDYYYRGYAGGQGLERDVYMSSADVASGYYVIDASPSTIVIDGDGLTVRDSSGAVTKSHTFDRWWVGRG